MVAARPVRERRRARFARGAQGVRGAPEGAAPVARSPAASCGGKMVCVRESEERRFVYTNPHLASSVYRRYAELVSERGMMARDAEPSNAAVARARDARHGGMMATSGSHRMQPFAGRGRRERSGSGRRPMGSVPDQRSESGAVAMANR